MRNIRDFYIRVVGLCMIFTAVPKVMQGTLSFQSRPTESSDIPPVPTIEPVMYEFIELMYALMGLVRNFILFLLLAMTPLLIASFFIAPPAMVARKKGQEHGSGRGVLRIAAQAKRIAIIKLESEVAQALKENPDYQGLLGLQCRLSELEEGPQVVRLKAEVEQMLEQVRAEAEREAVAPIEFQLELIQERRAERQHAIKLARTELKELGH